MTCYRVRVRDQGHAWELTITASGRLAAREKARVIRPDCKVEKVSEIHDAITHIGDGLRIGALARAAEQAAA